MDITPPKKPNGSSSAHRDRTQHRRAYLDTYAKNRVQIDTTGRPQNIVQNVNPAQPKQQSAAQPMQVVQNSPHSSEVTLEDMANLWVPAPQAPQSTKPLGVVKKIPVSAKTKPASPKSNIISDFKKSFKASQATKKQERVLQKKQITELKLATESETATTNYVSEITKYSQPAFAQQATTPPHPATINQPQQQTQLQQLEKESSEGKVEANLRALYAGPLSQQIAASNENTASASHMRTIIASAFACGIMAVGIFTIFGNYGSQPVVAQPIGSPVIEVEAPAPKAQSGTPVATGKKSDNIVPADPSHPVRIIMSSIGINAPVQGLGTTPEGLMAVPESYGVVGWYNKGAVPGQPGPAVLAGHYTGGNKGVFDKLQEAQIGELITMTNGRGQTFTYKVTAKNEYGKDNVPMAELFKKSTDSRLEIITCSGKWQANQYDKRVVVSAEIVR